MAKSYDQISRVFSEGELILLEDALRAYEPDYLSEKGQDMLDELKSSVIAARRWAHQFGKSQH